MKPLEIQQLTLLAAEDLQQIYKLEQQLFEHEHWNRQALKDLLQQDYNNIVVARRSDLIVGYSIVQVLYDTAEILRIGVSLDCQRQGIAKQILEGIVQFLGYTQAEKLMLEVREDNYPAIKLYESVGFEQIHLRKHYYHNVDGTATHALILQKTLRLPTL